MKTIRPSRSALPQLAQFWQSNLLHSATMHERMAELQQAAGRPDLAHSSRQVAVQRRVASGHVTTGTGEDVAFAVGFGEWAGGEIARNG